MKTNTVIPWHLNIMGVLAWIQGSNPTTLLHGAFQKVIQLPEGWKIWCSVMARELPNNILIGGLDTFLLLLLLFKSVVWQRCFYGIFCEHWEKKSEEVLETLRARETKTDSKNYPARWQIIGKTRRNVLRDVKLNSWQVFYTNTLLKFFS